MGYDGHVTSTELPQPELRGTIPVSALFYWAVDLTPLVPPAGPLRRAGHCGGDGTGRSPGNSLGL